MSTEDYTVQLLPYTLEAENPRHAIMQVINAITKSTMSFHATVNGIVYTINPNGNGTYEIWQSTYGQPDA